MPNPIGFLLSTLLVASGLLFPNLVLALETPDTQSRVIEEVVVVARKREENLQEVPMSVSALDARALEQSTMSELKHIQEIVPNVAIEENTGINGSSRVFIRGVGESTPLFTSDPAVGVYVDGIPLTRVIGGNLSLFDIERIEVLRGPQGTLYGKNTIGGAINYISRKPADEFGAAIDIRAGNENRLDVTGYLEGRLTERLTARVSAGTRNRDGFTRNHYDNRDYDDEDSKQARLTLNWMPGASWNVLAIGDYYRSEEKPNTADVISVDPTAPFAGLANLASMIGGYGISVEDWVDGHPREGTYNFGRAAIPGSFDSSLHQPTTDIEPDEAINEVRSASLIAEGELSERLVFKSLTGYRDIEFNGTFDNFGTSFDLAIQYFSQESEEFSQEIQLIGSRYAGGRLDFVTGLYYGRSKVDDTGSTMTLPELMALPGLNLSSYSIQDQVTTSKAGFANVSYDLSTRISATLGLRYTEDEKEFDRFRSIVFVPGQDYGFGPAADPTPGQQFTAALTDKYDDWSGTASLQYTFNEDIMAYASWSRGFRSGGVNGNARTDEELSPYDSEILEQFEVGFKSMLAGGRLLLNATAFFGDYSDRQLLSLIERDGLIFTTIDNIGELSINGLEIESKVQISQALGLFVNYGYLDGEFEKADGLAGLPAGVDPLELEVPQVPDTTVSGGFTLDLDLDRLPGRISIVGTASYKSKMYFDLQNSDDIAEDGYALVNARVTWLNESESLEVAFWGRNLADSQYRVHGVDVGAVGVTSVYYGDPRTYGLDVKFRF